MTDKQRGDGGVVKGLVLIGEPRKMGKAKKILLHDITT